MRAVPARAGGYDTAFAAPECAAAAGCMHAARSGRPGHALLPQVCPSATLVSIHFSCILLPASVLNIVSMSSYSFCVLVMYAHWAAWRMQGLAVWDAALAQAGAHIGPDGAHVQLQHPYQHSANRVIINIWHLQGLAVWDAALAHAGADMGPGGGHVLRGCPGHAAPARSQRAAQRPQIRQAAQLFSSVYTRLGTASQTCMDLCANCHRCTAINEG